MVSKDIQIAKLEDQVKQLEETSGNMRRLAEDKSDKLRERTIQVNDLSLDIVKLQDTVTGYRHKLVNSETERKELLDCVNALEAELREQKLETEIASKGLIECKCRAENAEQQTTRAKIAHADAVLEWGELQAAALRERQQLMADYQWAKDRIRELEE